MSVYAEVLSAVASVLQATAWPAVAVFVVVRYHDHVGRLLDRLRKAGPGEFDPLPNTQVESTSKPPVPALPAPADATPSALVSIRTLAVEQWEENLKAMPVLSSETIPAKRESALLTVAAKAVLISTFERAEASIYGSQLELLAYLNTRGEPESAERIRETFYEPASTRFPELYRGYSFDGYLGFLSFAQLISIQNLAVSISQIGREYLLWRVEQRRLPRTQG